MSDVRAFKDWQSPLPKRCDLCGEKIVDVFVDGKVHNASWAIMCPKCFSRVGSGLGPGKGQMYVNTTKVEMLHKGRDYDSSVKEVNGIEDE